MSKYNFAKKSEVSQDGKSPDKKNIYGNLDAPELLDYSKGTDGIPWIENSYIVQLIDFGFHDGFKLQCPAAMFRILDTANPDSRRTTSEGKVVQPAKPGDECRHYFRVDEPKKNGFDIGENERKTLVSMAAALKGYDSDGAKEAMVSGEFSVSKFLGELEDATADEIEAKELVCKLDVKTGISKKTNAFRINFFFSPLDSEDE